MIPPIYSWVLSSLNVLRSTRPIATSLPIITYCPTNTLTINYFLIYSVTIVSILIDLLARSLARSLGSTDAIVEMRKMGFRGTIIGVSNRVKMMMFMSNSQQTIPTLK